MVRRNGEFFPKSARLRKRSEFLKVQSKGIRVQSQAFLGLVLTRERESGESRLGITTTKRIGNAVARNRCRRIVREAFRKKIMNIPPNTDVVVIAKAAAVNGDSDALFQDLKRLGLKMMKQWERSLC